MPRIFPHKFTKTYILNVFNPILYEKINEHCRKNNLSKTDFFRIVLNKNSPPASWTQNFKRTHAFLTKKQGTFAIRITQELFDFWWDEAKLRNCSFSHLVRLATFKELFPHKSQKFINKFIKTIY